jgi:hypothetical protein
LVSFLLRVNRDRAEPAAIPAVSAMPRTRPSFALHHNFAMCQRTLCSEQSTRNCGCRFASGKQIAAAEIVIGEHDALKVIPPDPFERANHLISLRRNAGA